MMSEVTKSRRHEGAKEARTPLAASRRTVVAHSRSVAAFTLIELMIAISVLLVVIIAIAQIFGTASRVTGLGQASASVLQEAAVIERHMREDIARLSGEGFFAIRQVAVPNNVHIGSPGGRLLNPVLPPNAWVRADQLVFFADGAAGMTTFGIGGGGPGEAPGGTSIRSQGSTSRVYYGHGFQLPEGPPADPIALNEVYAHDPQGDVLPWHVGDVDILRTWFATVDLAGAGGANIYERSPVTSPTPVTIDGTQPEARRWLLARQAVALVDDDHVANPAANEKTSYLTNRTARSIFREFLPFTPHGAFGWSNEIRNGRMDGAASRPDLIRRYLREFAPDWHEMRHLISTEALYYPRAERSAPSAHRVDQALTNHVIGSAVSSFIVEWTWDDRTGEASSDQSGPFEGFRTNWFFPPFPFQPEQPWFGLNFPDRGVGFMGFADAFQRQGTEAYWELANFQQPATVLHTTVGLSNSDNNVERYFGPSSPAGPWWSDYDTIHVYEAIFGYNRNAPLDHETGAPTVPLAYTPWPSAIRVTMVLHDPQVRLEHGREFQFVIDLPRRVRH